MKTLLSLLLTLIAATAGAQEAFSLHLGATAWPRDPRTQARLVQWESPMGRLMYEASVQQAGLGREGLAGRAPMGLAMRLKSQSGVPPQVISAALENGVQLSETGILRIRWPWEEDLQRPDLPLEQQISLQLGRRLEIQ